MSYGFAEADAHLVETAAIHDDQVQNVASVQVFLVEVWVALEQQMHGVPGFLGGSEQQRCECAVVQRVHVGSLKHARTS